MIVYLFGEDSYEKSQTILKNIVTRSLCLLEPNFNFKDSQLEFGNALSHWMTLQGNSWKKKKPTAKFSELCMFIADIYESDDEFIFWHIDADTIWDGDTCLELSQNIIQFEQIVFKQVGMYCKKTPLTEERFFEKLILIVPFYSIEAWLYENYDVVQLSHKHEHALLKDFKKKHGDKYDMIFQIKNQSTVRDSINSHLSNNFPTKKINELGMSYSLFLKILDSNKTLKSALPKY